MVAFYLLASFWPSFGVMVLSGVVSLGIVVLMLVTSKANGPDDHLGPEESWGGKPRW